MVVRTGENAYVIVLVPGDRVINWGKLREHLNLRRLALADADQAFEATGYRRGTITPLGIASDLTVIVDADVAGRGEVSVGSGLPGTAIHLDADDLIEAVGATPVHISKAAGESR